MGRRRKELPSQGALLLREALESVRNALDALADGGGASNERITDMLDEADERIADMLVEAEVKIVMALDWQMMRDQWAGSAAGLVLSKKDIEMLNAPPHGPTTKEKERAEAEEKES